MARITVLELCVYHPVKARIYSRVIQPIQSKYIHLLGSRLWFNLGPTSYSRGNYALDQEITVIVLMPSLLTDEQSSTC